MSDLNATINLTEAQIKDAVMQYVRGQGYYPISVRVTGYPGGSDQRDPPYTTAAVTVTLERK